MRPLVSAVPQHIPLRAPLQALSSLVTTLDPDVPHIILVRVGSSSGPSTRTVREIDLPSIRDRCRFVDVLATKVGINVTEVARLNELGEYAAGLPPADIDGVGDVVRRELATEPPPLLGDHRVVSLQVSTTWARPTMRRSSRSAAVRATTVAPESPRSYAGGTRRRGRCRT